MELKQIVLEELKKEGLVIAEENIELALSLAFEKIIPRVAAESDNSTLKMVASGIQLVWPTIKPKVMEAADLNKDGHVGLE